MAVSAAAAERSIQASERVKEQVCVGMLLPPVVLRQVFVFSICFLVTYRLSGLVWTRCARTHTRARMHAQVLWPKH